MKTQSNFIFAFPLVFFTSLLFLLAGFAHGQGNELERKGNMRQNRNQQESVEEAQLEIDWLRGDWLSKILKLDDVQSDLEIVDSQLERLRTGSDDIKVRFRAGLSELNDEGVGAAGETQYSLYQIANQETRTLVTSVLLPHQIERLNQIINWAQVNSRGGLCRNILNSEGLDEESKQKIEALDRQYTQELRELKQRYRDELLNSYPENNRRKIVEMLGEPSNINLLRFGF